jgi:selenocysteine lyase/cysteine desulfurase
VCSAYKFFGPHVGILYGKMELLEELKAYKVRPAPNNSPGKWMTGTQNHEGIAGVLGTLEYFEWLADQFADTQKRNLEEDGLTGRRLNLVAAMIASRAYEFELSRALIEAIQAVPGTHIHGITDMKRLDERVPTVSFTWEGKHPREIAEVLGKEGLYVWDGNYYALAVTERLGVESSGGMVRVGAAHYNTLDEVELFGEALKKISRD